MKFRKLILILLCLAACVGVGVALSVILPNETDGGKLLPPDFLRIEGHTLHWDKALLAERYEVEVNGEIRTATGSSLALRYADDGAIVRVRSVSRAKEVSEFSEPFVVRYSAAAYAAADVVTYKLAEHGVERKEFIESGVPVSIDPEDYSPYGYEFLYWYETTSAGERRIYEREVFRRSVIFYAKVSPIDYPLSFVGVEGFPFAADLPNTYNALSLGALLGMVYEENGYRLAGWCAFSEAGEPLSAESVFTGPLTLYPRISLINEGLEFERCEGGWAVGSFSGLEGVVHVPDFYLGEPVGKVSAGAFKDFDGARIEKVIFYGDIALDKGAFDGCVNLGEVVFHGSVRAPGGAFKTAEPMGGEGPISMEIFGVPNLEVAFIAGYLDMPTAREVAISVRSEYAESLSDLFPDFEITEI
ncbi:MAG: hypothetical protein J6U35_04325 [Clostridia bacterium]|nr:hypothetical protein [Clostridia bacterium]